MPPPDPGPLASRILNTRPELRHILKAGLMVAALKSSGLSWTTNSGFYISIVSQPIVNKKGLLELIVQVENNGTQLELDNPFLFLNPPLLVPDGGTWVDEEGNENKTFVEDAAEAARVIIAQAVGVA